MKLDRSLDGVPTGIRTPVIAVKGRCPRPLDDGDADAEVAFRFCGVPTGIRTPVIAVKGRCPRPLDDGDADAEVALGFVASPRGFEPRLSP